ncbi:MAG: hypothetical protein GY765_12615 [bacterium]|nr:hypothetical protein [bacterium]
MATKSNSKRKQGPKPAGVKLPKGLGGMLILGVGVFVLLMIILAPFSISKLVVQSPGLFPEIIPERIKAIFSYLSETYIIILGAMVVCGIGKFIYTEALAHREKKKFFAELTSFDPGTCTREDIYTRFQSLKWEANAFKFIKWLRANIYTNPAGQWPPKSDLIELLGDCPGKMMKDLDKKWRSMKE